MQGHAPQRQDEDPTPFRRQAIPKNRAQLTELVHRETQANVPTRAVLGIRFSEISRVLSNYQRCFVWGIENRSHYVRDVTFGEDKSHTRIKPVHFARFRSFAINILRANGVENIARELYLNALNFNNA
ncbi:MAG: ISMca6, transposase, OrfB, partial [Thermomicrobiales bacterium]|nr:ISMca6, transposase, OrfB [Thermomicrobiales bacterium]